MKQEAHLLFYPGGEGRPRGGRGGRLHRGAATPPTRRCFRGAEAAHGAQRSPPTRSSAALRERNKTMVPGAPLFFQAFQDSPTGRASPTPQYQYTLYVNNTAELYAGPELTNALVARAAQGRDLRPAGHGPQTDLVIDRDAASAYDLTASVIDNTLYDAFGQRQVYHLHRHQPVSRGHGVDAALHSAPVHARRHLYFDRRRGGQRRRHDQPAGRSRDGAQGGGRGRGAGGLGQPRFRAQRGDQRPWPRPAGAPPRPARR